ncbi:MAG: carboxypeptidase regulatory-like domain-containing protein [Bryobacteraceae bacterium]
MRKTLLSGCLLILLAPVLWSQAVNGTLSGKITTASGEGVPNAAVIVTDTGTNVSQRALTGPDGSFSIAGLAPGAYRVDVETAGFKRSSIQNVELSATAPAAVNITLEPGNINETVEIKGFAPTLQGQSGEVHLGLPDRTVRELPVIDRNFQQLVQLQTGVTPPVPELPLVIDPARNRFFSVNGQTPFANMRQLDGVQNFEPFRGGAIRVQPVEDIQQTHIVTAGYQAEKGYTPGAFLTNITRGGANQWHGSLFEFHSDNELRSRPFFDRLDDKPRFTYNQFGGTLGGRIIQDKTFFFGSYEGTYNRGLNTVTATVPTAAMRAGVFTDLPGVTLYDPASGFANGAGRTPFFNNTIPAGSINPASAAIQSFIPPPNLPDFANNYQANVPYQNDANKFDGRLDHRFSDRTAAFLRYGYSNLHAVSNSIFGSAIAGDGRDRLLAHNVTADVTHSFTPNLLTEFRVGYNRYTTKLRTGLDASAVGFAGGLSNIAISGMEPFGLPVNLPTDGIDNSFNWVWNFAWHSGRHNARAGTDIRRFRSDGFSNLAFSPAGSIAFGPGATLAPAAAGFGPLGAFPNSYAAFLLGAPATTGSTAYVGTPSIRQSWYAFYFADNIQVMHRLNIDLGIRWDVFSPLEPRRAGEAMFYDPAFNTLNFAGVGGQSMRNTRTDLNNVAPRIGFAYRPTERTVIRGAYDIRYFQMPYQYSGFMPTIAAVSSGAGDTFDVAGPFSPAATAAPVLAVSPVNGMAAPNVPLNVVPRDLRTPYVQSFSVQVQREIVPTLVGNLGYVASLGRQLPYTQELNAGLPGMGIAGLPLAGFGRTASTLLYDNGVNNNYHSFQASLSKRFAHGLAFQGAYTWSKALGYTFGPNNLLLTPNDRHASYGPLDYDRQHVLTLSHVWELPFGAGTNRWNQGILGHVLGNWQVNGIFSWATGTPLTVTTDPLFCNCPNNTVLANVAGPVHVTDNAGFGSAFFNTGAFSAPAPNSFGNAGRGTFRGPGFKNYDASLFRSFPILDQYKLEIRGEVYNISNTPRFMNPTVNLNSPAFGQITNTYNGAFGRQFNLAVRILF